jgi:membrane associated rhomboid family serine protease
MHQASVGFHCPDCTRAGAQKVIRGPAAFAFRPIATQVIIAINIGVFVVGLLLSGDPAAYMRGAGGSFDIDWGLIAKGVVLGADGQPQLVGVGAGEWYRMVTSGFLHSGGLHLAMNMWALWILGQMLERAGGRARFALIYGVSLLGGSCAALLLSPGALTVGASGAIFGLMGAALAAGRARGVPLRDSPLFAFLVLNLVITFAIPGISIGGHLGGLVAGVLAGWLLFDLSERPGTSKAVTYGLSAAIGLASLSVGVVFATNWSPV